jgi:YVTN family beta-propeller protein
VPPCINPLSTVSMSSVNRCGRRLLCGVALLVLAPLIWSAEQIEPRPNSPFFIYVTNKGSGDVAVIDGLHQQVLGTIALGKRLRVIAADPLNHRVFLAGRQRYPRFDSASCVVSVDVNGLRNHVTRMVA